MILLFVLACKEAPPTVVNNYYIISDDTAVSDTDSQVIDTGDSQVIDTGDSQVIDTGDSQVIDTGDSQVIDTGDSQVIDTGDSQVIDTGDTGPTDTGTGPTVCDTTVTPLIVAVEYSCNADLWDVRWELAGTADHVHVDFTDSSGSYGWSYSEYGDFSADCCEELPYNLNATCGGMNATLYVYDASNAVIDCVQFGAWGFGSACPLVSSTPIACTP